MKVTKLNDSTYHVVADHDKLLFHPYKDKTYTELKCGLSTYITLIEIPKADAERQA